MSGNEFATAMAKLHGVIELLERSWSDTREQWSDAASRNVEEKHLRPIVRQLNEVIESTVPLSDVVTQARRACGPERE